MPNRLKPPTRLSNAPLARARRLAKSAPERARRVGDGARIRARRATHRRGYLPGLLSIVVPGPRARDPKASLRHLRAFSEFWLYLLIASTFVWLLVRLV